MTDRIKVSPKLGYEASWYVATVTAYFPLWGVLVDLDRDRRAFALSTIVAPGTVTSGSLLAMVPFAGILAIVATGQRS